MNKSENPLMDCPVDLSSNDHILMAHGGGGRMTKRLIDSFVHLFDHPALKLQTDSADLRIPTHRLAFTTDSFVIHPLFFPGGDIGSLAIHGTVNDLAMSGAKPLFLSAAFILEEGFSQNVLLKIIRSMKEAADRAEVQIVTGDTKVVERGKGDGIYINTAGIGVIEHSYKIEPLSIQKGDFILISGDIGRHGIAVMSVREGLKFDSTIESDSAPLSDLVLELMHQNIEIHCMRDLTRGGLASALNEIASTANLSIQIQENAIPVREDVQGACEILGLDPLYVANEGRFILFIPKSDREKAIQVMHSHPLGASATVIGEVIDIGTSQVNLLTTFGVTRTLDILSGEQLPRIC